MRLLQLAFDGARPIDIPGEISLGDVRHLVHPQITTLQARELPASPLSATLCRDAAEDRPTMNCEFEAVGQVKHLTRRVQNILRSYPSDAAIRKDFV